MHQAKECQLVSLVKAARHIHKARSFIRKAIDAGELPAFINGGSKEHPRLVVDLADVEQLARLRPYLPPQAKGERVCRQKRSSTGRYHPDIARI